VVSHGEDVLKIDGLYVHVVDLFGRDAACRMLDAGCRRCVSLLFLRRPVELFNELILTCVEGLVVVVGWLRNTISRR